MLIKKVLLKNFGIYGGEFTFDLVPRSRDYFDHPIVLFVGKNGVGKTTFVEAIRLCLHGSLALSARPGQIEFEQYLIDRINRSAKLETQQVEACVEVEFDYTNADRRLEYKVSRYWSIARKRVHYDVKILENDQELELPLEEKDSFLRELIPPTVTDLFFFDGEKLQTFIKEITNNIVLENTVKSFLGLNLVTQLQKDLDIFISRQLSNHGASELEAELQNVTENLHLKENFQQELLSRHRLNQNELNDVRALIQEQEQKIANEGGWYAKRFDTLQTERVRLNTQIELTRHQIHEMCNGLIPFAIAPDLLQAVNLRLAQEREYQKKNAAGQIVEDELNALRTSFDAEEFWKGITLPDDVRSQLKKKLRTTINRSISNVQIPSNEMILEVSEREQETLSRWIESALNSVPYQFHELIKQLSELDDSYQKVDREIRLSPSDEKLQPLTERLNQLTRQFGASEHQERELNNLLDQTQKEIESLKLKLRQVRERITEVEKHNHQITLASQTQSVLDEYIENLTGKKLALLENYLVDRFNSLCRKKSFIESARIDPEHFTVTLYRNEQPFTSDELSAGEKQLFAIAIIWALHTLSGLPIPVIIDTPLARLDIEHRHSMLTYYLPHASHQVIVLATDAEVNSDILAELSSNLSHKYLLEYNGASESTMLFEVEESTSK